jgi:hypothetical protein
MCNNTLGQRFNKDPLVTTLFTSGTLILREMATFVKRNQKEGRSSTSLLTDRLPVDFFLQMQPFLLKFK